MNGTNGKQTRTTRIIALVPYPVILAATQGRPGRNENGLAAFQRLHSPPFHAEALRRARQRLLRRGRGYSRTAASKADEGCPRIPGRITAGLAAEASFTPPFPFHSGTAAQPLPAP